MARTFEDFPVGRRLLSRRQTLSAEEMVAFARAYDPQPFHLGQGGGSLLGELAASGWQTASVSMRLFIEMMEVTGGIVGRAVDELRWPLPVRPGDSLQVEIEILQARRSKSRPGFGLLRYRSLTRNQHDEVVQSFCATALLPARNEEMGGEGIEPPTITV